jgi:hypothetical protein
MAAAESMNSRTRSPRPASGHCSIALTVRRRQCFGIFWPSYRARLTARRSQGSVFNHPARRNRFDLDEIEERVGTVDFGARSALPLS